MAIIKIASELINSEPTIVDALKLHFDTFEEATLHSSPNTKAYFVTGKDVPDNEYQIDVMIKRGNSATSYGFHIITEKAI